MDLTLVLLSSLLFFSVIRSLEAAIAFGSSPIHGVAPEVMADFGAPCVILQMKSTTTRVSLSNVETDRRNSEEISSMMISATAPIPQMSLEHRLAQIGNFIVEIQDMFLFPYSLLE